MLSFFLSQSLKPSAAGTGSSPVTSCAVASITGLNIKESASVLVTSLTSSTLSLILSSLLVFSVISAANVSVLFNTSSAGLSATFKSKLDLTDNKAINESANASL